MADTPEKTEMAPEPEEAEDKEIEEKKDDGKGEAPKPEEPNDKEEEGKPTEEATDEKNNDDEEEKDPDHEASKEETDEGEEKAPEPETELPAAAAFGRPRRTRKKVDAYVPAEEVKKKIDVPKGNGQQLNEMKNVVANFSQVTWSSPHLKMLHSIVFGIGKKRELKEHLLEFSGLVYAEGKEETEREKIRAKIVKLQVNDLKSVMDLVDIERGQDSFEEKKNPTKEMLCDRLLEWLEEPSESGRNKRKMRTLKGSAKGGKASKSSKSESSGKKRKAAASKPKKAPAKKKQKKKQASSSDDDDDDDDDIEFNIPGTTIDQVRAKVKSIVEKADKQEITVKNVRKKLEDWLDADLKDHKDTVRALAMEAMENE